MLPGGFKTDWQVVGVGKWLSDCF